MSAVSSFLKNYAIQEYAKQAGPMADPVMAMLSRNVRMRNPQPGSSGRQPPAGDIQQYAKQKAKAMFGPGQWDDLDDLVTQESSWNPKADNPTSTAYGLFQFLDSTWGNYGGKTHNPYKQVNKGLRYIADRYGNPEKAWDFYQQNNWY